MVSLTQMMRVTIEEQVTYDLVFDSIICSPKAKTLKMPGRRRRMSLLQQFFSSLMVLDLTWSLIYQKSSLFSQKRANLETTDTIASTRFHPPWDPFRKIYLMDKLYTLSTTNPGGSSIYAHFVAWRCSHYSLESHEYFDRRQLGEWKKFSII